jgi:hypothetical protein
MDLIDLIQIMEEWKVFVKTVKKLQVPQNIEKFLSS